MTNAIQTTDLAKVFGTKTAVSKLNLSVREARLLYNRVYRQDSVPWRNRC